jgi:hypothetical protein
MTRLAPIRAETKNAVLARDAYKCVRCDTALTKSTTYPDRIDRRWPDTNDKCALVRSPYVGLYQVNTTK